VTLFVNRFKINYSRLKKRPHLYVFGWNLFSLCLFDFVDLGWMQSTPFRKRAHKITADPVNDLVKEIHVDQIKVRITYKPTDLLVAQELRSQNNSSAESIQRARDKYKNHYYFVMSLSIGRKEALDPATGLQQFNHLLNTISFRMGEVVNMTTVARDTVPITDFIYNRTFGIGASTDVLILFDKTEFEKNSKRPNLETLKWHE
jgi:hypothetical protein